MKEIDILAMARENVRRMTPYSSARDDFKGSASIYLDANENPFPTGYNRYPDPHQRRLKEVIAGVKGVRPEQIFLGNGSDEAIDLLYRAFCEPAKENVVIPQPTYGMYSVSAAINNVNVLSPTLTPSFELDSSGVLEAVTPFTKLIFLCSPNNPSGNLLSIKEIENILKHFSGLVVIDEAYIDFADTPSWTTRLEEFRNLVVLQTFSKAWGLAGLRLGMCFAHPLLIGLLDKIKPPYNINAFTQSETLKAITSGTALKNEWVKEIKEAREAVINKLKETPSVRKIFPTDANFILVEMDDAGNTYLELVKKGIIVRDRSQVILCNHCLRITVGTKEENNRLVEAMQQI